MFLQICYVAKVTFWDAVLFPLETIMTWNEISTLSAYGLPHPVGPPLLPYIVGNVSPYKSNGRSEIRVPREVFLLAAGADFGS